MKVVYFCEPQVGGTYTFFERLRDGMKRRGAELVCVPPMSGEQFEGTRFANREGVDYVKFPDDLAGATRVLRDYVVANRFDVAMNLPGCDVLTTNLLRYLPRSVRTAACIQIMTEGTYRPTRAIVEHLDGIACVCHRIQDDLAGQGVPREKLSVIYNSCDVTMFAPPAQRDAGGPLRLVYAGRLEDLQKNVSALPRILARVRAELPGTTMTIAGHGPDGERLRGQIKQAGMDDCCRMIGAIPNEKVADLYRESDLLVMPTRFEGSSFAMMEAMACGCPPVVSLLRGSTDTIAEDGISGCLCRVDDIEDFAGRIVKLGRDRAHLARMQAAAVERIRGHFTVEHLTDGYMKFFTALMESPDRRTEPLDVSRYEIPRVLRPTWRRFIPAPVKKFIRTRLERMGKSA